jgi:cysteine desulfurase / selenocysteine lyase
MFNLNVDKIREDFPYLNRKINGKKIVYFDNAATTQKPRQVLDSINEYYIKFCANVHRGVHKLSQEASTAYEESHKKVGKFVNAKWDETIFTKNTTESLNLVYYAYGLRNLKKDDEVLTTTMEHHSDIVPLLELSKVKGINVKYVNVKDGKLDMDEYNEKVSNKTKMIIATHSSNVLGTINDVKEIGKIAKDNKSLFIVDGAQSVPHMEVDFKKLNADFLAFSAHKMLGPTGMGALVGKRDVLEEMDPFLFGGDMIKEVKKESYVVNDLPWKFEAGTPNIAGGIGFGRAVDYLSKIGMNKVRKHEMELVSYALDKLKEIDHVTVYGVEDVESRGGVVSFNVDTLSCHNVAGMLDSMSNVMCRSGVLCAQPLVDTLNKEGVVRASFYIYNTQEEVDVFIESLKKIVKIKI